MGKTERKLGQDYLWKQIKIQNSQVSSGSLSSHSSEKGRNLNAGFDGFGKTSGETNQPKAAWSERRERGEDEEESAMRREGSRQVFF